MYMYVKNPCVPKKSAVCNTKKPHQIIKLEVIKDDVIQLMKRGVVIDEVMHEYQPAQQQQLKGEGLLGEAAEETHHGRARHRLPRNEAANHPATSRGTWSYMYHDPFNMHDTNRKSISRGSKWHKFQLHSTFQ